MRKAVAVLVASVVVIALVLALALSVRREGGELWWAYQLQDADPDEIAESGFDIIVMDYSRDGTDNGMYSAEEIARIKESGKKVLAYISIGEAEDYRFYWRPEWNESPPEWLGRENPEWPGNYPVRFWYREWKEIIFSYLDKIIEQGFDGVYLDKVDVFEYWADPNNGEGFWLPENETAKLMISFIEEIAEYCRKREGPGFMVIPQNGERLLLFDNGTLRDIVTGWALEDVFYNGTEKMPESWVEERLAPLGDILRSGEKLILVVDYVDDGTMSEQNMERVMDFISLARERGLVPYAARSDRELDELNVIPGVQP